MYVCRICMCCMYVLCVYVMCMLRIRGVYGYFQYTLYSYMVNRMFKLDCKFKLD